MNRGWNAAVILFLEKIIKGEEIKVSLHITYIIPTIKNKSFRKVLFEMRYRESGNFSLYREQNN